ncbi:MAG TPA: hypothetical protein VGG41_11900 [Solirubrobacteraceae bacterium]
MLALQQQVLGLLFGSLAEYHQGETIGMRDVTTNDLNRERRTVLDYALDDPTSPLADSGKLRHHLGKRRTDEVLRPGAKQQSRSTVRLDAAAAPVHDTHGVGSSLERDCEMACHSVSARVGHAPTRRRSAGRPTPGSDRANVGTVSVAIGTNLGGLES